MRTTWPPPRGRRQGACQGHHCGGDDTVSVPEAAQTKAQVANEDYLTAVDELNTATKDAQTAQTNLLSWASWASREAMEVEVERSEALERSMSLWSTGSASTDGARVHARA